MIEMKYILPLYSLRGEVTLYIFAFILLPVNDFLPLPLSPFLLPSLPSSLLLTLPSLSYFLSQSLSPYCLFLLLLSIYLPTRLCVLHCHVNFVYVVFLPPHLMFIIVALSITPNRLSEYGLPTEVRS